MTDDQAPLGFLVRPRSVHQRRFVLVDRCGFVLGTASRSDQIMGMIASHLTALRPAQPGVVRMRLRGLISGPSAMLCAYPLLFAPTFDEDHLTGTGHLLLDRLGVDIEVSTGRVLGTPVPWPVLEAVHTAPGHIRENATDREVTEVVFAQPSGPSRGPTAAQLAASIAAEAICGNSRRHPHRKRNTGSPRDVTSNRRYSPLAL